MTDKGLKELKDTLWHSADVLRASAHLAANKYGQPILGLIFLRYADILYKQHIKQHLMRQNPNWKSSDVKYIRQSMFLLKPVQSQERCDILERIPKRKVQMDNKMTTPE